DEDELAAFDDEAHAPEHGSSLAVRLVDVLEDEDRPRRGLARVAGPCPQHRAEALQLLGTSHPTAKYQGLPRTDNFSASRPRSSLPTAQAECSASMTARAPSAPVAISRAPRVTTWSSASASDTACAASGSSR